MLRNQRKEISNAQHNDVSFLLFKKKIHDIIYNYISIKYLMILFEF
jgi:hypothetical protein